MPVNLQTRLLRVLEEREIVRVGGVRPVPVDVRVISATHCDLETRIKEGRFRADLFYRLAILRLQLPSLRDRHEDILPLAEWSLKLALANLGARPHVNLHAEINACGTLFERYPWPGNVRELRNIMERVALFLSAEPLQALTLNFVQKICPELASPHTSIAIAEDRFPENQSTPEENFSIEQVLERFNQNREAAAAFLGISRTTLWRKLKKH